MGITDPSQSSQDKVSKGCTSTWPPAKLRECHGHGTSEWMPWRRCQNWRGRRALKIDELKRACQIELCRPRTLKLPVDMTWTSIVTQAAQFTTCFQSKCHLVKSPLEAKAAKCPCFFNEKAYGMVWITSLSFCSQKLSLESVNAFGAIWSARIQSPKLPRKRGERVCASHLFEYGKKPRPSSYPSKIVINQRLLHTFPISSCFIFPIFCGYMVLWWSR